MSQEKCLISQLKMNFSECGDLGKIYWKEERQKKEE